MHVFTPDILEMSIWIIDKFLQGTLKKARKWLLWKNIKPVSTGTTIWNSLKASIAKIGKTITWNFKRIGKSTVLFKSINKSINNDY